MEYRTSRIAFNNALGAQGEECTETLSRAIADESYVLPESSLHLPFDEHLFAFSRALAETLVTPKLSHVLHIGIGGSNLGARALYEVAKGISPASASRMPTMLFADTCAPELIESISEILLREISGKEEIIVIIASKSGTTTETIVNASILINVLEKKVGPLNERIVCITDEDSSLWNVGKKFGYHCLPVPKIVGGRYSACSPMGVFPLLCMGVDAEAFLRGAKSAANNCITRGVESDAFKFAHDVYLWHEKGTFIFDFLAFHPELEGMGKWYRQLFAESLGKAITTNGEATSHHIVPSVSIGSTDLHSAEQLYMAQPKTAARILVRANEQKEEQGLVVSEGALASLAQNISNRPPREIMEAIYAGVLGAYRAHGVSFGELALGDLGPEELGAMMQFFMCGAMHIANLFHVNAFDQPDVEAYKKVMKTILSGETNNS